MRYRLQIWQTAVMPNILGNHSFPVYTHRWKDVAVSEDQEALREYKERLEKRDVLRGAKYRIIDTREETT